MKRKFVLTLLIFLLVLNTSAAFAVESEKDKNWDFSLAPLYIWMVNMEGDLGIGPVDANNVDIPFDDIFDNLESIFTIHFEGLHRSNWGFLFDLSYLDVSVTETAGPLSRVFKVDMTTVLFEAGGYYRYQNGPNVVDFLGGVRYTELEPDVTVTPPGNNRNRTEDWIDPMIGLRYFYHFNDKWLLALRGDIGGFEVGSDFTWNVIGLIQWQPWKYAGILAGYRVLDQDYEEGSGLSRFKWDMRLHGPVLAVNFIW